MLGGNGCLTDEPIAFADEQVADVQRDSKAVFFVQRFFAVTLGVFILDVVVDQGRLVETFHGNGDLFEILGNRFRGIAAQRLKRRYTQERPPTFAGACKPVAANRLGVTFTFAHDRLERVWREPCVHLVMQGGEIQPACFVVAGEVDIIPNPIFIYRRVDAVILQQRNRHTRHGRRFHVRKGAFQNGDTSHANDGVDLARLNETHHDRAAFSHERSVAELLRLVLEILNAAQPAALAEQAKLIERRRALGLHAQAFGHHQQPALKRHGRQRFAPKLVVDEDADVVAVYFLGAQRGDKLVGVLLEILQRYRRHQRLLSHIMPHLAQDHLPFLAGLRNILTRLPRLALRHHSRNL